MTNSRRRFLKDLTAAGVLLRSGCLPAVAEKTETTRSGEDILGRHPAASALHTLFPERARLLAIKPTGLLRTDYLSLIAGVVQFFRVHQTAEGAILDPYTHREVQYSTPAFAAAAAVLVRDAGREDLREPAERALTFALRALANHTTADGHADFYIPMIVHARRWLTAASRPPQDAEWTRLLSALVPETAYRDVGGGGNWNLVNVAGECLRRRDGLVAPALRDAQMAYIERSLARQENALTRFGMYRDPNAPLAYDLFPRLWIEDVLADGAYEGAHRSRWAEFLTLGGLSTLLLLSPSGEWPCGGRSAHHQWNEAAAAVVCEANAVRWKALGRPDVAGSFKRGAHLALTSLQRWRRPSGELWIVKNRADPALRHGYEGYSYHSQYNLLPMAMLAIAFGRADDTIPEAPLPAETGSYVFDLRNPFHKVCACAGGTYVLLDTAADPHYNATGLMRVHHAGAALSAFSDNTAAARVYGPPKEPVRAALAPGLCWNASGPADPAGWISLADFAGGPTPKPPKRSVESADLREMRTDATRVSFTLRYRLAGEGALPLEETCVVSADGVEVTSRFTGKPIPAAARVSVPILVSDGATDLGPEISGGQVTVRLADATTTWEAVSPPGLALALNGPRIPSHNGWVRAASAELPPGTHEVRWRLRVTRRG